MKVSIEFDWEAHTHVMVSAMCGGGDHYSGDVERDVCVWCEAAASKSGIAVKEHFKHPKGCKCYWCVFCECQEVLQRESSK